MTRLKHSTSVTPVPISEALRIHPRFMRSVQLERDIDDAESSKGYILTPMAADAMKRITSSFRPDTTQRAWRIAGDYGSGKTDFALALSRIAMGLKEELPRPLGKFVGPLLKPAMATGDRESLARTILRAIGNPWAASSEPTTEDVIEAVRGAVVKAKRQQYEGLLLIVDELGKNLEFAASHPERDDVFLLQRLAEEASRSRTKALVFVVMLHQGVASYAQGLDTLSRREWDKVAGRFEEIVFAQPIEQVTALVAATLDVRLELLPMSTKIMSRSDMEKAIGLGFFGNSASNGLIEHGATVYPFHPTVIPVLLRTMRRFGQNERSLFSFMSSNEALGLQDFARRDVESGDHYRISNLFDYLRTSLLPNLTSGSAQTHWGVIDAVLASTLVEDETENAVMKTTALLTLLDAPDLPATKEVVQLAVGGPRAAVNRAISNLQARGVLYERGSIKGLCLWPHTSVNLDEILSQALEVTGGRGTGIKDLCRRITSEQLVPRAYYAATGTLRYANVEFLSGEECEQSFARLVDSGSSDADLRLFVALPLDEAEFSKLRKLVSNESKRFPERVYMTVAPPQVLAVKATRELAAWEWIGHNTPALAGDRFAREEVSRQTHLAERNVRSQLGGLDNLGVPSGLTLSWYSHAATSPVKLKTGRELLTYLGEECERIFPSTPRILNELINRKLPSSAAVGARTKLVEAMATSAHLANLGLDEDRRPPEMALYMSILRRGNFHVHSEEGWIFRAPSEKLDVCKLLPALEAITSKLQSKGIDAQIPIPEIFTNLSRPPYGIREGLQPFVVAIYLAINHQRVALYEDGTYLNEVGGEAFLRMMKEPQYFAMQYCELDTVRAEVLNGLLQRLMFHPKDSNHTDILDLLRPLMTLVARDVPDFSRKTKALSATAAGVRTALLNAREPVRLVFTLLPEACGYARIESEGFSETKAFAGKLKEALHEIRQAYPELLVRLTKAIYAAFGVKQAENGRQHIMDRAQQLGAAVTDPTLKAFALRLSDSTLDDRLWIESIANLLARKSPERWTDTDEVEFNHQLQMASSRFRRTELALIGTTKKLNGHACRIALTKSDGTELGELIHWDAMEDHEIGPVQSQIEDILAKHGKAGMAAAMLAIWQRLEGEAK